MGTEITLLRSPTRLPGTRDGPPTLSPRSRSPVSPLLMPSTTSSSPPSVSPMPLFVFPSPTSTTLRVLYDHCCNCRARNCSPRRCHWYCSLQPQGKEDLLHRTTQEGPRIRRTL